MRTNAKLVIIWIAIAIAWLVWIFQVAGCADDEDVPLPTCPEVGCPDGRALICRSIEICLCPQPGGKPPIDCRVTPMQ